MKKLFVKYKESSSAGSSYQGMLHKAYIRKPVVVFAGLLLFTAAGILAIVDYVIDSYNEGVSLNQWNSYWEGVKPKFRELWVTVKDIYTGR